jgi:hypothetical protein
MEQSDMIQILIDIEDVLSNIGLHEAEHHTAQSLKDFHSSSLQEKSPISRHTVKATLV